MTADVRVKDVCHGLETLGLGRLGRGLGCCKAGTQQPSWKMVIWKMSVSVVGADAIVKVRLSFPLTTQLTARNFRQPSE